MVKYFYALICCVGVFPLLPAQQAFYLFDDGEAHLIRRVTASSYRYGLELERIGRIGEVPTALLDHARFVPGFIEIRDHRMMLMTTLGASSGWQDKFEVQISVRARANRDLKNVFMLVEWRHENGEHIRIACPVGEMRAGRSQNLRFELSIPPAFRDSIYNLRFFCEGVEIVVVPEGGKVESPWERYLVSLDVESPPDGPPHPITIVRPRPVLSDEEFVSGRLTMMIEIDEKGYVRTAEVESSPSPDHSLNALDAIRLWEFKPLVRNGGAAVTRIRVPFDF